jgi:Transglutaminase-like superfamily
MGKSSRERRKLERIRNRSAVSSPRSRRETPILAAIVGCAIGVGATTGAIAINHAWPAQTPVLVKTETSPTALGTLLTMTPEQLAGVEVARMNLLSAQGLPGAEKLDVRAALATIDQWAVKVKQETERHLYRATDARWTDHYGHSQAKLRAEMLLQVLQEDLSVHYNMDRVTKVDFTNSKDLFIHGLIDDKNGGTCVSMPVLYTAVARRLGYPVKLVEAKSHLFTRWDGVGPDGKQERFNFDGAGSGISIYDDDSYYRKWPRPISDDEVARGEYLKSLSPAEEFAVFLAARGHCLLDTGKVQDAQVIYAQAHRLHPASRDYFSFFVQSVKREMPAATAQPTFVSDDTDVRRVPSGRDFHDDVRRLEAANRHGNIEQQENTMPRVASPYPSSPFGTIPGKP